MENQNIELVSREIKRFQGVLEEAKTNEAKLSGQLESLFHRLETEEGIGTIEEAEKKLIELEKEEIEISKKINVEFSSLKEQYEW